MKKIVDFSTVEGFWVCYCHLARPSTLPSPTDLHLFKEGTRPLWEDSVNCKDSKWIIQFKKVVSGRFWEDLVLALVSDQLDYGDNICSAVLSIRFNEDILSVWNRNALDHQAVMALRDSIKRHLKHAQQPTSCNSGAPYFCSRMYQPALPCSSTSANNTQLASSLTTGS